MSYILDALKRADAERERGAVPGLQSRHMPTPTIQAAHGVRNRVWLATFAAALALGGIAVGLWLWQKPAVRMAAVEPAVATPPVAAPLPAPASLPAPAPAVAPPRIRAPSPPAAPKPVAKPAPAAAQSLATAPKTPVPAAAVTQAVPLLGELSEDIRRQMPPLAISGAVYSKNPGQRLLLVNNQVVTQGSLAAPDVTLEEIQAKSSVFSFRGTRFRVAH
ncbi:MAG: hypothetical protein JWP96_2805 [Polaromonas sp.]|nr:hypothetical protein [Polaromonas sp.]